MEIRLGAELKMLQRAGLGNQPPATLILDEQGEIVTRMLGEARKDDTCHPID